VAARPAKESEAIPAVTMAPVFRKERRVTGEAEGGFLFIFIGVS
jgi:hypothetical protein